MLRTSVGEILVNGALPPELRRYGGGRVLDKAGLSRLLDELAERRPDQYAAVASALVRLGGEIAGRTGGFSFGVDRLRPGPRARRLIDQLRRDVAAAVDDETLDDEGRAARLSEVLAGRSRPIAEALMEEEGSRGSPIVDQIRSGAKGSPANLMSLLVGDLLYTDAAGRPVPVPILRGYGQGLTPTEYAAAASGARKGVVDLKSATPKGGYLSKQLTQLAHRLVVTAADAEDDVDRSDRGLPVPADDPENDGALLARAVGPFPRNTVITPRIRKKIRQLGHEEILVRSPSVGGPPEGGVYARDVGRRERGDLAPVGDFVGIAAAHSLSEPITQSLISSKHAGGVAGQGPSMSSFEAIDRMMQVPQAYGGAVHAQRDGTVREIRPAPQGGRYLRIGDEDHYLAPDRAPAVRVGDRVEAGDALSDGLPNPGELVRHKGIGEGRRAFVEALMGVFRGSGMRDVRRRNVELVARGLIDHVEFDAEHGPWAPGDVAPYSAVEAGWEPRPGTREGPPESAAGYLERPVLHYSVGTRVTPAVAATLRRWGVPRVATHDQPPPFSPRMIPARENLRHDPDLATRHLGSGLQRATLDAVHRGAVVDPEGTSFVPGMARRVDFGRVGRTRGWAAGAPAPPAAAPPPADDDGDDEDDDF